MFVDRTEANQRLDSLRGNLSGREKAELYKELDARYNIPAAIAGVYFNQMRQFDEASDYLVFCFMSILNPNGVGKIFTPKEIKIYSAMKYGLDKIKFPYVFKDMVQVAEDQWIGKTTLQELMRFRNSSLINYNEETQRPMTAVVNGDEISFKITVNKKAVEKIAESIMKGTYVPDDITINIPEENVVEYDDGELIIPELGHMDILDGYHRWVAMSRINNIKPTFDYPMEIRITHFATEKARYYIYQKEQKTRMKKESIRLYNQYDPGLLVCNKMNQNASFDLNGKIGTGKGMIPISDFARVINTFYFTGGKAEMVEIVRVAKEIIEKFNSLIESDESYFGMEYDFKTLYAIVFAFINEKDIKKLPMTVKRMIKEIKKVETTNRNKLNNILGKLVKKEVDDGKTKRRGNIQP